MTTVKSALPVLVLILLGANPTSWEGFIRADEPTDSAEILRLPFEFDVPSNDDSGEDRTVVVHAGGTVVVAVPPAWEVREIPWAREIRLAIAESMPDAGNALRDGMWLAYHHQSNPPSEPHELEAFAMARFESIARGDTEALNPPTLVTVNGHAGVRMDFRRRTANADHRGFFLLAAATWGHCELYCMAPSQDWPRREREFSGIVSSLRLNRPQDPEPPTAEQVYDAELILGSWKSYRGRLRLFGDGRVSIVTDRPFEYTSDDNKTHEGREITGRFQARRDLLLVVWDDGSKLNFRWRQQGNRLLLTDHDGRMTQLRRILE